MTRVVLIFKQEIKIISENNIYEYKPPGKASSD